MAVVAPGSKTIPTFAEAEAATDLLSRYVSGLEVERHSGEDAVTLVGLFTRVERIGLAGKTRALHRVDQTKVHTRSGHRSPAEYVASVTGDPVGETKDLMRLGEQLADQPHLADDFVHQKLSRRRATQASDAARVNPGKERDLAEAAGKDSDARFKERCQRERAAGRSAAEAEEHRKALHASRTCRTWTDDDGALCLRARFAPEAGAGLQAALGAQADRHFDLARREGRFESPDAYRADALMALVTGTGILGPGASRSGGAGSSDTPTDRPPDPRATVSVVVDLGALRRGEVADGERCEIPGVGPVPVEYARSLLGEALVELLVAKGTDVTTVYSAGRHIPRRVRSALLLRDPRCVVPGCDARLGLENDHWVTDFAKGGLTALDNLARLCRRHHRDRTHHGFTLQKDGDTWIWTAPEHPVTPKRPRPKKNRKQPGRGTVRPPATEPPRPGGGPPPRRE
jgi:5-methylcytosine-specific restriction endonuclease McrA